MKAMSRVSAVWGTLLALNFIPSIWTHQDSGFQVRVSIYDVPPMIVSRMFGGGPDPRGGVSGIMVTGVMTASFPKGVVLLQDRLPGSFANSDVRKEIADFMATSCILPQMIDPGVLGCHDFEFSKIVESQEQIKEIKARGVEYLYRLRITPGESSGGKLPLRVEFWVNRRDPRQVHFPWEENAPRQILDCCVAAMIPAPNNAQRQNEQLRVALPQAPGRDACGLLIGVATLDNDGQWGRTVYWLAVSVEGR